MMAQQSVFLVLVVLVATMITAPTNALVIITLDSSVARSSAYCFPRPTTVGSRCNRVARKQRNTVASPSKKCSFVLNAIAERSLCETDSYDAHHWHNISSLDLPTSDLAPDRAVSAPTQRHIPSVVAENGNIITSVSNGVRLKRVVSNEYENENSIPSLTVFPGRGVRITAVSSGVTIDDRVSDQSDTSSRPGATSTKKQAVLPLIKAVVDTNRKKGVGPVGKVLSSIRTVAAATTSKDYLESGSADSTKQKASYFDWKSNIQSTVSEMLPPGQSSPHNLDNASSDVYRVTSSLEHPTLLPHPGTILLKDCRRSKIYGRQITIRSSVPHSADDMFIANLRLSVFSNFDKEKQDMFRSRSLEVLNVRRRRGAVALVAEMSLEGVTSGHYKNEIDTRIATGSMYGTTATAPTSKPKNNSELQNKIIGSVECSQHEFHRTILGNLRPKNSLLYVTEVAVCPEARRCGAGMLLMKGVDEVAALRDVETIYLHVDVTNHAACAMYEKAGYKRLDKREPMYAQFTASLNLHDGALMGRCHYLMCKNRTGKTTWLDNHGLFLDKTGEQ
ncbi:hypothetical protein HJC23_004503 [Cyclotella cryptica]|uniref:N-acetyltransferase domain-containing protein n=1 Tax=Cyclotella cryptica TaxID=29204 RepID=A0ABD3PS95_9STRA|eukprot:CCRYP_011971-RA/>CCRYP_011971-RA protein AED:0.11 eAED:-0.14 QI:0/-1/0/1/-1/1/1/0/560